MSDTSAVSHFPNTKGDDNLSEIMGNVIFAFIPVMVMSTIFFGLHSLRIMLAAVISCLIFEYTIQKIILKVPATIRDRSAIVTGLLFAFILPPGLPLGLVVLGSLVITAITMLSSGKPGKNPFNPVLIGRIFLLILFPVQMNTWTASITAIDTFTGATPLGLLKNGLRSGQSIETILADSQIPGYFDMFWGNMSGSLGEISAIAILMGGLYLIWKKVITWHIPLALLGSVFIIQGVLWMAAPGRFTDPVFHLITGGVMLGAFFIAPLLPASPISSTGKLIFGAGIGLITVCMRNFGPYPEGVSFAILMMNGFTPLINTKIKTKL